MKHLSYSLESMSNKEFNHRRWVFTAAVLSILVLVAHAIDAPDHLKEWWGYGTFFVIVAAFQFFLGLALFVQPWQYAEDGSLRRDPEQTGYSYYVLGITLSLISVIAYIITRATGLPFLGPDAAREPITILSLLPPVVNLPLSGIFLALVRRPRTVSTSVLTAPEVKR